MLTKHYVSDSATIALVPSDVTKRTTQVELVEMALATSVLGFLLAVQLLLGVTKTGAQECACSGISNRDGNFENCELEDVLTNKIDGSK